MVPTVSYLVEVIVVLTVLPFMFDKYFDILLAVFVDADF
jgi:hypothetical protein